MPKVLVCNDYPGYQRVALAAQVPILEQCGLEVLRLPTALFSNTLNYPEAARLDTTDFMKETLGVWERLGFSFEAVSVGFTLHAEQTYLLKEYCMEQRRKGVALFCDPVLGDHGKMYRSVTDEMKEAVRALASVSDYASPNYTEACLLTGTAYKEAVSEGETREILDALTHLGIQNPVITSIPVNGKYAVAGYDGRKKEYFITHFKWIPVSYYGTGDCFMAYLMAGILKGDDLRRAVERSIQGVETLLEGQGSLEGAGSI